MIPQGSDRVSNHSSGLVVNERQEDNEQGGRTSVSKAGRKW